MPEDRPWQAWEARVAAVVDEAHAENLGGKHRSGFCEACADAYLVAQRAVPGGPGGATEAMIERAAAAMKCQSWRLDPERTEELRVAVEAAAYA